MTQNCDGQFWSHTKRGESAKMCVTKILSPLFQLLDTEDVFFIESY